MNRFIAFILTHRTPFLIALALTVVLGIVSWQRLPIDAFPDVTNQQVMILTEAEGLAPVDVERQVTFPIETVMGGLPHVRLVRSMSKTGLSQVVVVFEDHVDTYFARQLVFERLQLAAEKLPPGIEPEMGPISTGLGEIFQYTLESDRHDLTELRTMHDWLVAPRLRSIPGVNEVNSFGGLVRQIHVHVDPDKLLKFNLTLQDVNAALAANNANAGGSFILKDWEQENIRSVGLFQSVRDVEDIVLQARGGTPVYVADVAAVSEGHMTRLGAVSRDGEGEVVAGMVIMLKGENSKEVVERVKAAIPEIQRALPEGVHFDVFYDRTDLIRAVIGTISGALLQGGFFVILVLLLVVGNARSAITAALSLPLTALIAFIFMDAASITANLMSLGGLAVAIGMVVDGSIVVTENVVRHLREKTGASRGRTIIGAVQEVARPILFSILIIILVFVPLFSLQGMEGKMFKPLALTMIFAMLGSLIVALTFVPAILSYIMRRGQKLEEVGLLRWMRRRYLRILEAALNHRRLTTIGAAVLLIVTLVLASGVGREFLPQLNEGALAINIVRLPNASIEGSVRTAGFMERQVLGFPEVETVVSKTGRAEISEDPMGPEQTDLLIMLHPQSEWETGRSKAELVSAIQDTLERIPGVRLAFSQPIELRVNELISGVKSDLAVKIFGYDIELLKESADEVASVLRGIPGAQDVSVEQVAGFTQLEIIPNRRAMARYQLNVEDLNAIVATAIGGTVATEMVEGQMRFGVLVRFPPERRDSEAVIEEILIPTPAGARVPLGQVAELRRVEGPAQISREDFMRRVVVEVNVRDRDLGGFVSEAEDKLDAVTTSLPAGYWIEYGGTFENQQRAMRRLSIVVPLSILLIFLMLMSALGSVSAAGLVLINLPFALVGGLLAMLIMGVNLNVPATVGFIALFGTGVQNGTVLVTFINQLRRRGVEIREAVVTACSLRFRALIMTAATTVLGLTPMIYATGSGSEIQRPLATVVIGGLITATMLTLVVLPTIYYWARPRVAADAKPEDGDGAIGGSSS
ncbi:MAG: CusA/CzcA family heavy metal efflux RND transporter [Candidatus Eisenbacteria bacterium]|nr:CusA/CzcA family heavy metal efflux RND transporter [Candidatus Eisenbacteria bacterium]